MPLKFKSGDMFSEPTEALVNTVNCVGVMGKGVALEFKRRWPENFKAYQQVCKAKTLTPGVMFVYDRSQLFEADGPRYLVNFPTKAHWRAKSQMSYIEDGLDALVAEIEKRGIRSIAMPPLGCGNGGLEWADVEPVIRKKLERLPDVEVVVFAPKEALDDPEYAGHKSLSMTYPRAMLLKAFSDLESVFDGAFDRISMQKIVYFLQVLGVDFGLKFQKHLYGPYSESLKMAFATFDKYGMISGFRSEERRAHATPAACAKADEFLQGQDRPYDDIIERLSRLIEGYESPYGLELLSSIHWLNANEDKHSVEGVVEALQNWNERKRNSYDDRTIRAAYQRLVDDRIIN